MDAWKSLLSTALVGTDRQRPQLASTAGALESIVEQLDWQAPEKALLDAASAIDLHQRTGWRPSQQVRSPITPFEGDDSSCCSSRVMQYLEEASHTEIEMELLDLMHAAGQSVPAKWLPKFLARAKRSNVRSYFMPVIGRRGQWLAAQNPDWAYVAKYLSDHPKTLSSEQPSTLKAFSPLQPKKTNETDLEWLARILVAAPRWNMETSTLVLNCFFKLAKNSDHHPALSGLCVRLGLAVHPGLQEEIARQIRQVKMQPHDRLERLLNELYRLSVLRHNIYVAFIEPLSIKSG